MEQQSSKAQVVFDESVDGMTLEDIAKQKFIDRKEGSFYYIIDSETGGKCITEKGKTTPFRTRVITKLATELFMLREAYKRQLKMEGE